MTERNIHQFKGFLDTPPLWNGTADFGFQQYEFQKPDLREPLPPLHISERLVLGKRIEHFFEYYIRHFTSEEIIAANEQIIAEKQTLGELDFLLGNSSGNLQHVELVFKFYVYDPSFKIEKERWIGPNRRDTLVKKLDRLQKHQLPLIYREETKPLLSHLKVDPTVVQQKVCFKAHLFVPHNFAKKELPLINNECVAGVWMRQAEFTEQEFGNRLFFSPKKKDWPMHPREQTTWYSYKEIRDQLTTLLKREQSPLVWMKTEAQEFFRFFLVWW